MLDVALVGTGGMIPLHNRYLTAMLARYNGNMLLVDCGEGTQVTLRELGWGFVNLECICFTHFHADHISGLPGLLLSLSNYGRKDPLTIVGSKGIENIVNSLRVIAPELMFVINFIELSQSCDFKVGEWNISALRLEHGMECYGYSINIARLGKFDIERAKYHNIPVQYWSVLQKGEAVKIDDKTYTPDMVLGQTRKGLKLSYVTDTRPIISIAEFVKESDLFICEGMYGEDNMKAKAHRFYHMIFSDAATLAKQANVKELWLTHYSQAFSDAQNCIKNATDIFENSIAGYDRMTKTLSFDEN